MKRTLFYYMVAWLLVFLAAPAEAARLSDVLDADRLAKYVKADADQKATLSGQIQHLKRIISDYQWDRNRKTCEAALWMGNVPDVKKLRKERKEALKTTDAIVEKMKEGLSAKQARRMDKLLDKGNLLDVSVSEHPFHFVQNAPLFTSFHDRSEVYKITLPGMPDPDNTWTYAQLLKTWTIRGYIPAFRPIDDPARNAGPGFADHPDLQTRVLPTSLKARLVQSPLLISATLQVPDLSKREFELVRDHFSRKDQTPKWNTYQEQNRLEDAIQVRLKLNTPYNKAFLNPERWIIFLEDSEGIGYEPIEAREAAFYPLEALQINLPGTEMEVTDVFGQYYPYIEGNKERFYLEAPATVTYVGNEKLVRLFFPGRDFQGNPVVTEDTKYLKLVVQSEENDFGRSELIWELKKPKSKFRPKG